MNVNVLKSEKNEIEFELDSVTIAEILRAYLNKDSDVSLAVWKREHYQKPIVMKLRTKSKTAKKALDDAISAIEKESNSLSDSLKNSK
jgi:DNA-directed RNA polymerase subunit L